MFNTSIPIFCKPCIIPLQAACPHTHSTFLGGWHFVDGDFWEDFTEICSDCGANLDELWRLSPENPLNLFQPEPFLL